MNKELKDATSDTDDAEQIVERMDAKEFRELGYLQELNRRFLHPLGLAIEVIVNEDGTEHLGGIWDYRDDKEGLYFDLKNSDNERIDSFNTKYKYIENQLLQKSVTRQHKLGFAIEPIPVPKES